MIAKDIKVCCHALPCSIEYQGVAPAAVPMYFHPMPMWDKNDQKNHHDKQDTTLMDEQHNDTILTSVKEEQQQPPQPPQPPPPHAFTARFRGRQLVATTSPIPVHGRVLHLPSHAVDATFVPATDNNNANNRHNANANANNNLVFDSIQEWHHDDTCNKHTIGSKNDGESNTPSRVMIAMDWFRVAAAVHDEIETTPTEGDMAYTNNT